MIKAKLGFVFFVLVLFTNTYGEEIVLSGEIQVLKPVIYQNKTIKVMPATKIFIKNDLERSITFENCYVLFEGSFEEPILIEGIGDNSEPEDKNLFHIENSTLLMKNVIFKNGGWFLHIHNTQGLIENCFFHQGYGAIRFTGNNIEIRRNIFLKNHIAIRFIKAQPVLENNLFYENEIAVFFREGVKFPVIRKNSFIKNNFDFYGGFFQEYDIETYNNYFYNNPSIFDKEKDGSLKFKIFIIDSLEKFPDWH